MRIPEADVQITDKLFMPASEAGAPRNIKNYRTSLWDEVKKGNYFKDDPLGPALYRSMSKSEWESLQKKGELKPVTGEKGIFVTRDVDRLVDGAYGGKTEGGVIAKIDDTKTKPLKSRYANFEEDSIPSLKLKSVSEVWDSKSGENIFSRNPDKLFMPASEAGAGKGKQAEAAKRLKDLKLSAKKDPLDNRDRNHLLQASLLEGIINESQGGAELDIRIGKHESGEGSRYIEYASENGDSFKIRATDHDRQLSSITNHRRPDFTLASNKRNVSESSGDWIDAIVKLENETDFRVPERLEDRINTIINRRKEIQRLEQEITQQERLAQEQARKAKEEAEANALETPKGKRLSEEINSIRLELQNSSGTGKYTKNQRKSMFKKVRRLEDELEAMGTFDAGERNINYMPSDRKAPTRQPANRITRQAPAMPGNRFMLPAASAGARLSERFR
jgi:hypothetical protein